MTPDTPIMLLASLHRYQIKDRKKSTAQAVRQKGEVKQSIIRRKQIKSGDGRRQT